MDIPTLLQQIPPGVDVFDFLAQVIEDQVRSSARWTASSHELTTSLVTLQVYPSLGKAFAVQVYV
jgi:hypothetical protein